MTSSTVSIIPGASAPGVVPAAEPTFNEPSWTAAGSAFARASSPDYFGWLHHVRAAAGCSGPIRLNGALHTVVKHGDSATIVASVPTSDMPDGVIYKACGNRRAAACPSCSAVYQNDAYQLLRAGLVGGKGVPASVAEHPAAFATFTAPSFGPVHSRVVRRHTCGARRRCDCRAEPCRPRRVTPDTSGLCPHGRAAVCFARHEDGDARVGEPLCPDCYDYDHHVVWNMSAGELWRRTKQDIDRYLARTAKARGISPCVRDTGVASRSVPAVHVSHGKAAEFQARGAIHFHVVIRLDGTDPTDPDAIVPPPAGFTTAELEDAIRAAGTGTAYTTVPHPVTGQSWPVCWGVQLDVRPITLHGGDDLSDRAVAGYLAKYATKSTEATGHISARITADTVAIYTSDDTHTARLIAACWRLGTNPTPLVVDYDANPYLRLRRWAHMLGFGGHFLTKAPRFSATFGHLRANRADFRRHEDTPTTGATSGAFARDQVDDVETVLVVATLIYTGSGWHTHGDALLANTAAAAARQYARTAREEVAHQHASTAGLAAAA